MVVCHVFLICLSGKGKLGDVPLQGISSRAVLEERCLLDTGHLQRPLLYISSQVFNPYGSA